MCSKMYLVAAVVHWKEKPVQWNSLKSNSLEMKIRSKQCDEKYLYYVHSYLLYVFFQDSFLIRWNKVDGPMQFMLKWFLHRSKFTFEGHFKTDGDVFVSERVLWCLDAFFV